MYSNETKEHNSQVEQDGGSVGQIGREGNPSNELRNGNRTDGGSVLALIEQEMEALLASAQTLVQSYWRRHYTNKVQAPRSQWGSYGVRARVVGVSLVIEWFRLKHMVDGKQAGSRGKGSTRQDGKIMIAEHVPKGRGYQYSDRRFTRAMAWELEEIRRLEPLFARIRKAAADLNKTRSAWRRYLNSLEEGIENNAIARKD